MASVSEKTKPGQASRPTPARVDPGESQVETNQRVMTQSAMIRPDESVILPLLAVT
jgi:hypothetical protein